MLGRVDRFPDFRHARNHPGGGLVVHHAHRLDAFIGIGAQLLLDRVGIGAAPPVAGDEFHLEAELRRHLLPQRGEMAGLVHQHAVARRQRVDERRFPGAGAGRGIDHHFALRALEHALHPGKAILADVGEVRTAMVDGGEIDGAQHAVGHVGRSRDLQQVAAGPTGQRRGPWGILTTLERETPLNAPSSPVRFARAGRSSLEARLRKALDAEVMFDAASRARYSTDASIYQIQPIGVVVPRSEEAARGAIAIAAEEGIPILPRGAGSSQCGQAVGEALVIDHTKYLNRALQVDPEILRAIVQPGMVLDTLNAQLRKHGLWFPVDVSTSAQATIGGMTGNNSCGSRSIAYGNMVHNVLAVDAFTTSGERWRFGPMHEASGEYGAFVQKLKSLYEREKAEIEARFPKLLRKVAGYNLDHLGPPHANAAHLLVGSEGTLAYSERLHLKLSPLPAKRSLGVCHFPKFYTAMELTQHIVKLQPTAVELVDRTMIGLAREIPAFEKTVNAFIKGDPDAILLVEFSGDQGQAPKLK